MNKKKTRCIYCGEFTEKYKCKECELSICSVCEPIHNHINAVRLVDSVFGKHEIEPCFFCGEKDENKLAIENLSIGIGMTGFDYSFCIKCLKQKTAFELIQSIVRKRGYELPLIMNGFDMSNHILLKKE